MFDYKCKLCNYDTNRKADFTKHIKTKKHLNNKARGIPENNEEKTLVKKVDDVTPVAPRNGEKRREIANFCCEDCGLTFTRSHGLSKHIGICVKRIDTKEATMWKLKLQEKEQQLKKSEMDKEYYRGLIDNLSTLGPKNFNSVTYILNNYAKAPHIKTIEPKKLKEFKDLDNNKIETIISLYRNNLLVDYVIEAIVYIHKKDDPSEQSVWVTDSSRHNYIIKELFEDKESYWIIDKKGAKSEKYLIDPVLKFIRENIEKYLANMGNLLNDDITSQKRRIILDSQKDASDLIKEIDDGVINKNIIKKLAKHIHHNTKPLIEEIE